MDARLSPYLAALEQAYAGPAWHGPSLRAALRGLTPEAASWRPGPGRPNAWEHVVHAAYWTYRVLRHVAPDPPAAFDEPGSDWFVRPDGAHTLGADLARLAAWHGRLRDALAALDPDRLAAPAYARYTVADVVRGAAAHHTYHAGQIRLVRALHADAAGGA